MSSDKEYKDPIRISNNFNCSQRSGDSSKYNSLINVTQKESFKHHLNLDNLNRSDNKIKSKKYFISGEKIKENLGLKSIQYLD